MSPAAVEFQSPFSMKPSSSVQTSGVNPNSNPFSSTFDHSQNQSHSTNSNSSGLDNAKEFGFGIAVGVNKENGPRFGSGRSRVRLKKVRKHVGKSRTSASEQETGSDFNLFRSTGEDSGPLNNCSASSSFSNNRGLENSNRVSNEASVSNESCSVNNENVSFVFGANLRNAGLDCNLETPNTSECTATSGSGGEAKMKLENEQECGNDSDARSQFGAIGNDLGLNLNLEAEEFSETLKKPASNKQFGVNQNNIGSTLNFKKSECNGNADDSGLGFVFGASWCNSASNSNQEGSDSFENSRETASAVHCKMNAGSKTESKKVKATDARFNCYGSLRWNEDNGEFAFVLGGGNKKSSCSDDCATNTENGNLNFDVNDKSNFASENTVSNTGSALASIADPLFKLPEVMKKLNINEYENGDGTDKKYESNRNSCTSANTTFLFSSSTKPSSSSNGSSGPTDQTISSSAAACDGMGRENSGNGGNDHIVFGSSCNTDDTTFGSPSNQPFRHPAGLGKSSNAGPSSSCKVNTDAQANLAAEQASLLSGSVKSQQNDNVSETPSMVNVQNKVENVPTDTPKGLGVSFTDFVTPNWDPSCLKASLYPELSKKLEFSINGRSMKDKRSKRTKGKLKQPSFLKKEMTKHSSSQETPKSPECYSPMDFSPYMETTTNDQPSRETCVTSEESLHPGNSTMSDQPSKETSFYPVNSFEPSALHSSVSIDLKDENVATAEKNDFHIADQNCRESNKESPWKGFVFGSETACSSSKEELADGLNAQSHEAVQYSFASGIEDQNFFTFSASSSVEGGLTSRKCQIQKRNKKKVGKKSSFISPSPNVKDSSSSVEFSHHAGPSVFSTVNGQEENKHISKSKEQNKFEAAEPVKKGSVASTSAFQESCEMWRLRGNQSYKNGNLSKAEDYYTQGINSVPLSETAGCCIKALVLCYSNRAATRISLGRIREALEDCMMAITVDPYFCKVYMRAANCHLALGEVENALQFYKKFLQSGTEVCLDRRLTIEAADGLQKALKVANWTKHSAKLLEQKTSEAASDALEIIAKGLSVSSCSEKLLELKAEALCMLRRYEEAIQLCEQTLGVAEKNFASVVTDNCSVNINGSGSVNFSIARLWRWHLISKSYFCMGKLEAALDLLQKLEEVGSIRDKCGSEILESSISLAATVRELLRCKNAGNEAVRSGRFSEAVEHYTVALSSNVGSRPFAAICFCNRAAALQALGQIADAIADCSLAMALDANYTKAVSRRAALHEMIRDYAQAASDLQRLVSILENQSAEKAKQSGSPGRSTGSKDIRQAHRRMSLMEEEAKNGAPLDFYLILGVKTSDTAADIKKAYRKAALKHHPDKAGQFLARTESGDEGRLWKEIADEVHKDADRLFKMIGEAYAVLSDTTKRSEYDLEEELRKAPKESHLSTHYQRSSDAYNYSSRRGSNRQNWQNWKTYGNSYSKW